jgi:hypothetical protein
LQNPSQSPQPMTLRLATAQDALSAAPKHARGAKR